MARTENFEQVRVESAGSPNESKYVSRDEVLDELVSFGWVDGIRRGFMDDVDALIAPSDLIAALDQDVRDRGDRAKRIATTDRLAADNRRVPNA
jgi:hypothetical protein